MVDERTIYDLRLLVTKFPKIMADNQVRDTVKSRMSITLPAMRTAKWTCNVLPVQATFLWLAT